VAHGATRVADGLRRVNRLAVFRTALQSGRKLSGNVGKRKLGAQRHNCNQQTEPDDFCPAKMHCYV